MKIIFASEKYYPRISGVPVVVRYLAEELANRGHDVIVVTSKFPDTSSEDVINAVKVFRFNIRQNLAKMPVGEKQKYIDFVLKQNADIMILECAHCITTDILLPHLSKMKSKVILHSHSFSGLRKQRLFEIKTDFIHTIGHTYNRLRSLYYYQYWFKKYVPRFSLCLCLSEVDIGLPYLQQYSNNVGILGNAADDMFFKDDIKAGAISEYVVLENKSYMLSCANYLMVKDQKNLIRQYYMSESSKNTSLICIGSQKTNYYYECIDLVTRMEKRYGHRDVHLLQGVKREHFPSIIKGASLYVVSSTIELYSISIIECMSQGVPFISTNVGNAKMLPGGMTIKAIDEMHDAIDSLLADKDRCRQFSTAGKEFAYANCRIQSVVTQLEGMMNKVI